MDSPPTAAEARSRLNRSRGNNRQRLIKTTGHEPAGTRVGLPGRIGNQHDYTVVFEIRFTANSGIMGSGSRDRNIRSEITPF